MHPIFFVVDFHQEFGVAEDPVEPPADPVAEGRRAGGIVEHVEAFDPFHQGQGFASVGIADGGDPDHAFDGTGRQPSQPDDIHPFTMAVFSNE